MNKPKIPYFARFSTKEQAHFAKRLAFLIRAGVPVAESLRILRRQTRSKAKGKILEMIIHDVSSGQFLATSLARMKNIFGDFAINIIRVGESSGILEQNLNHLADELKKKRALHQKVVGAFIYPIFITIGTIGLTALLTVFIFPKLRPVFESMHVTLPLPTRILIAISDFLGAHGIAVVAGIIAVSVGIFFLIKYVESVRFQVHRMILKLPIAGNIAQGYNMTNFCRTLGLLLKGDIRIVEALTITGNTMTNLVYKKELAIVVRGVSKGERMSKYLEKRPALFPDMIAQMIAIGEETGNLPETLLYLSELYENEVDELTKNLSSTIEPLLMVFMGLIVGFIATSVITPIYEITQNLHR